MKNKTGNMGAIPCNNSITREFDCQFRVDIRDSRIAMILTAFSKLLPQVLMDFIEKVLLGFGEKVMGQTRKPFGCDKCGNDKEFLWKTRHGKETKILTVYQWMTGCPRIHFFVISQVISLCKSTPEFL